MDHKVFILRDGVSTDWVKDSDNNDKFQIEVLGNLNELNKLLDEGWTIKETIDIGVKRELHHIVYHLYKTSSSSSKQR